MMIYGASFALAPWPFLDSSMVSMLSEGSKHGEWRYTETGAGLTLSFRKAVKIFILTAFSFIMGCGLENQ